MQNLFKDYFYFSRGEKRGILMLTAVICIVFLAGYFISAWQRKEPSPDDIAIQADAEQEYEEFIASLEEKEQPSERQYTTYKKKEENIPVILASFNPNTTDSITFRRLGLPAWMAKNILHYRAKGGKFRKPEDFKKVYGMTEEQYSALLPYIHIPPEDTVHHIPQLYIAQNVPMKNIKYEPGTILDLNRADTTELKKIPGIGSAIARLIIGYRQRLGGFYQIEQLKDINLNIQQLRAWFSIDPANVHRINLNRISVDRLRSHPYINFYQAKAIVEYRKKKGSLTSLKPFSLYEEFTETDLERIGHYVCFE
jgi:DNA uptake protein ComE-like DNA-binding protein